MDNPDSPVQYWLLPQKCVAPPAMFVFVSVGGTMYPQILIFKSRFSDFVGFSLKPDGSNLPTSPSEAPWRLAGEISFDEMAFHEMGLDGQFALAQLEWRGFYIARPRRIWDRQQALGQAAAA